MTQVPTIARRGLVIGGLLGPFALSKALMAQTPVATPAGILPQGMLESATVPPTYQVAVTHSTLQAPQPTLPESCVIKVYPNARRTTSATSVVLRSPDLDQNPNTFLVQKIAYRDAELAASEFRFMSQEVVDVLAGMLIRQPQYAATDDPEGNRRRFEYLEPNGFNYALQVDLVGSEVHVVRIGGFIDPDWDMVDEMASWLNETDLDSLQRLDETNGWIVSYGPFDFHPDAYQLPDCFGP